MLSTDRGSTMPWRNSLKDYTLALQTVAIVAGLVVMRNSQDLWIGVSRDLLTTSDLVG
jgi:hypothetical protein